MEGKEDLHEHQTEIVNANVVSVAVWIRDLDSNRNEVQKTSRLSSIRASDGY